MSLTATHMSLDVTPRHQLSLRPRCHLEGVNVELPPTTAPSTCTASSMGGCQTSMGAIAAVPPSTATHKFLGA
jgi:hypothetical protein